VTAGCRRAVVVAILVGLLSGAVGGARAAATVQELIDATFADIDRGDAATDAGAKREAYHGAAAHAGEALRLDDRNADAHYALFCSLGRETELRGPVGQALMLSRLRRELDRTLELNPQHSEALMAKGEMLFRLPRLLGGDLADAESYLRRSLIYDPTYWRARLLLARVLLAESRRDEARQVLEDMLAQMDPQRRERPEAEELLKAVTSDE